jgi:hypothetical protein
LKTAEHRPGENPFRSEVIDGIRFRPQGCTWEDLLERLESLEWRAAIVGAEGTGKTALLDELAERSPRRAARVELHGGETDPLPAAVDQLPEAPGADTVVFFDGAEQLGPFAWLRFRRRVGRAAGLVITSHRPGRLPSLILTTTSPTLLHDLVAEIVPDDIDALAPGLEALFDRHDGNVRSCLRDLYDLYAGRDR